MKRMRGRTDELNSKITKDGDDQINLEYEEGALVFQGNCVEEVKMIIDKQRKQRLEKYLNEIELGVDAL